MPDLVHMKSLPEVFELRERLLMDVQNYNVQVRNDNDDFCLD